MRKIYVLFILLSLQHLGAQIINFPATNTVFKYFLLNSSASNTTAKDLNGNYFAVDVNNDNQIQVSEALQVSFLNVSYTTGSYMTTLEGIQYFTNLKELYCSRQSLTSLNASPLINLEKLGCSFNDNISILNVSGLTHLKSLYCTQNIINTLDLSASTALEYLSVGTNNLSSLNLNGLTQLQYVDCEDNNIINFTFVGCTNIKELYCSFNPLPSLDLTQVPQLEKLKCIYMPNLNTLDVSNHINLIDLNCGHNSISNINTSGCINLVVLRISNCQFTTIDLLGFPNLETLSINNNPLTNVDFSMCTNLRYLEVYSTQLQTIDLSNQPFLESISCGFNYLLKFLNLKNGAIENQIYFGNVNPTLPLLEYVCVDDEQQNSVEALAATFVPNTMVGSYCSFTPGGTAYKIIGNNKYDLGNDGCTATDSNFGFMNFSLTDGTIAGNYYTNNQGSYQLPVSEGTIVMTPIIENPSYYAVSPPSVSINFPSSPSPYTQDFCITSNGPHADLEIVMLPISLAVPGFDAKYKIIIKNKGTLVQSGEVHLTFNDAVLDFVSANPINSTETSDLLTWSFTDLMPRESRSIECIFNLNSPLENPSLNIGDFLLFAANVLSIDDENPNDNYFELNNLVQNSFDPNDKTCLEGNSILPEHVGKYLHYMIRFENNGTANAQNIVVKDMIDVTKFDISSLVPLDASHSFITKVSDTNKVEFIFENINLPFDDVSNDGYVTFKLKTVAELLPGNTVSNTASIYFDYNQPIITNSAETTITGALIVDDFKFSDYFAFFPNPVSKDLNIQNKSNVTITSIEVYNILGQLLIPNTNNVSSIDVSNLKSGNYIIKINSDKGTTIAKFAKN